MSKPAKAAAAEAKEEVLELSLLDQIADQGRVSKDPGRA